MQNTVLIEFLIESEHCFDWIRALFWLNQDTVLMESGHGFDWIRALF
jgi:hypothetical protein